MFTEEMFGEKFFMPNESRIQLHSIIKGSKVNGAGERYTIWMQGCSKQCENCYNPEMWDFNGGSSHFIDGLVDDIIASGCEGVTISGGDPFEQIQPLFEFLWKLNHHIDKLPKGIICFTGYTMEELEDNSVAKICINLCDLVIEGRYIEELAHGDGLSGSSNQRYIYNENPGRGKVKVGDNVEIDQDIEILPLGEDKYVITGFPFLNDLETLGIKII
jgi:anaerobic ribonucleoside-triphosphate reductase activating protein